MVRTLLRSALREIRQSLGRYLAILAIIGLGVGFFAGLRTCQPAMMATGVDYLARQRLYDFRVLSTLGFTPEDVDSFAALEGVAAARGAVSGAFLSEVEEGREIVLMAHSLTEDVNLLSMTAGRMPEAPNECVGDARYFKAEDLGTIIPVSGSNDEDTRDLLAYDSYVLVGLANSPYYLNYERGTSSLGSGSVAAFVYMPEDGFDFEAYYEIFLAIDGPADAYSSAYGAQADALEPEVKALTSDRAWNRYETLRGDALEEIEDAERELADAWDTYRSERSDADQEMQDAYQELMDAEQKYADGQQEYEQGQVDYADGMEEYTDGQRKVSDAEKELAEAQQKVADAEKKVADAEKELADGRRELDDGWAEYNQAKADAEKELNDAYQKLTDGEREYTDGQREYAEGQQKVADAERELADGQRELAQAEQKIASGEQEYADGQRELDASWSQLQSAQQQLASAEAELASARQQLEAGEAEYQAGYQQLSAAAAAAGVPLETFVSMSPELQAQWSQLQSARATLDQSQAQYQQGLAEYQQGQAEYQSGMAQYESGRAQLAQAKQDLDTGKAQLASSRAELEQGQQELASARQELQTASAELASARKELDDGWAEYNSGKAEADAELDKAYRELTDGEAELADGQKKLADGRSELTDGQNQLADGRRELNKARRELANAQRELDDAKSQLDSAPGELADARKELDEGWAEYNDGRAEADQEFADAEKELHDAERELADAREELADLKPATTYVLTRDENTGYVCFDNDTSIVEAISVVFPVFFFLVAALVCMTTMTRMVDEQRTQIGVLKALGYSNGQIMGKYLFYSGSAATVGSVLGYALGAAGLPWIIWEIYGMIYGFAPLQMVFLPLLAVGSFAAALLCSMGATWLACRVELRKQAAELIRPKTPRAGRRVFLEYITPLWKRLSFLHKVSVRNVLRYQSRLIMMVLGIGGCTALLCTGFGIRDSIAHVADDQFGEITLYDYAVTFQDGQSPESAAAYLEKYGWTADEGLLVHSGSVDVLAGEKSKSVYLVVSSTGSLEGFLSLHSGEEPIPYPGPGEVVLNVGLAENLGIAAGDAIQLRDDDLGDLDVVVSAIADNYVFNYAYVSPETYLEQLGETPEYNALYVLAHEGADPYEEGAALLEDGDVGSVAVNEATRTQVDNMLSRLDYIVLVVVLCAAALAFIVLYNLTNINITERIREIATIKVLGFYQQEVASYVFREINILSVLGSLAGLLMGKALHAFVMEQIQIDSMFFACRILPVSYLIAFCMTMLFTVGISAGMRPRLRRIDMAESLKSIE